MAAGTGIAFRAAGKSVKNFPAVSKFAGKLFQQGISDSHSLLENSDQKGGGKLGTIGPKIITLHHVIFQNYLCLM